MTTATVHGHVSIASISDVLKADSLAEQIKNISFNGNESQKFLDIASAHGFNHNQFKTKEELVDSLLLDDMANPDKDGKEVENKMASQLHFSSLQHQNNNAVGSLGSLGGLPGRQSSTSFLGGGADIGYSINPESKFRIIFKQIILNAFWIMALKQF